MTVYSELGQLGTVYTDGSGNYSINFTYSGLGNFAVRAGNDALGGNSGFGSATGTGSETVCTGSGSLVKHEMCPSSSVIGQTLSGFDFTYNVSCSYGMTYVTLPNCSEGTYTSSVSGVSGASDVRFATWSSTGGQNDLVWYVGNNLGGGNYNYTINSANHPGSSDTIYTDTYVGKCTSGLCPQIYCGGTRATRACVPSPTPAPSDNAACVSNTIPTTMSTGQIVQVNVRMNNNGGTTWQQVANYRLGSQDPQDNVVWGFNRVNLPVGSVGPGGNALFIFNVTAPSTAGTYNSHWKMVHDGVAWFGATCGPVVTVVAPTPTPTTAITISGGVYDDPNPGVNLLTGQCTGGSTGVRPSETSQVVVSPEGRTALVQVGGAYSVGPVAPGTKTITLQNLGSYQCTCPSGGCSYSNRSVTSANQSGWNFYVSQLKPVWWKAVGGHVHAESGLTSNVPNTRFLIDNASGGFPGVLTHLGSGGINLGSQGGTVSSTGWNFDESFSTSTWRYGYDALYARAGRPTPTPPGNGNGAPAASGTYLYSGATLTISGTWSNISNKIVIFATGDVQINVPISLTSSGFLAIIAKGNISVASAVGNISRPVNPTSTDASLTGVFLADGNFLGGTGTVPDRQLVIYGTVGADMDLNGTGNVDGQRNMGTNPGPGVAYVWNPNLMVNAPSELFESLTDWREAAP